MILGSNHNFGQKSKFWCKIGILVKNRNMGENRNLGAKSKFWLNIEFSYTNRILGVRHNSHFFSKKKILHFLSIPY